MIYYNKLKDKRFRTIRDILKLKANTVIDEEVLYRCTVEYKIENGMHYLYISSNEMKTYIKLDITRIASSNLEEILDELFTSDKSEWLTEFDKTIELYKSLTLDGQLFEDSINVVDHLVHNDQLTYTLPSLNKYKEIYNLDKITLDFPLYLFIGGDSNTDITYTVEYKYIDLYNVMTNNGSIRTHVLRSSINVDDLIELI